MIEWGRGRSALLELFETAIAQKRGTVLDQIRAWSAPMTQPSSVPEPIVVPLHPVTKAIDPVRAVERNQLDFISSRGLVGTSTVNTVFSASLLT